MISTRFCRWSPTSGVAHYLIHSCRLSASWRNLRFCGERLRENCAVIPHALHMPRTFSRASVFAGVDPTNLASAGSAQNIGEVKPGSGAAAFDQRTPWITSLRLPAGAQDQEAKKMLDQINTFTKG